MCQNTDTPTGQIISLWSVAFGVRLGRRLELLGGERSQRHQQLVGAVRGTTGLCFVLGHSPEKGLEKTAPEKGCIRWEARPECSPRDAAAGAASAQLCFQHLSQATQAGGSRALRCFGDLGNSSGMRWYIGCQAPPPGFGEPGRAGEEGLCFEIISNIFRGGGCQLALELL